MFGTLCMEHDLTRGARVLRQIRRSFLRFQYYNDGKMTLNVKGVVKRKTMTGSSKLYEPMDFTVNGQLECAIAKRVMEVLPPQGCRYCVCAPVPMPIGQHPNCCCDKIFLQQRDPKKWRPEHTVWFKQSAWSKDKFASLTTEVCNLAKTKRVYTNGSIRATAQTAFQKAKLTPNQVAQFSKSTPAEQEKYKRLGELMTRDEVRQATSLITASGREALRGKDNQFGSLKNTMDPHDEIYKTFKSVFEKEEYEDSGSDSNVEFSDDEGGN